MLSFSITLVKISVIYTYSIHLEWIVIAFLITQYSEVKKDFFMKNSFYSLKHIYFKN